MRGIPPARIRYALAAAFLVLVLVGVWLANLDRVVNVAVIVATAVLLGFVEWTTAREAARAEEEPQVEATSEVDETAEEPAAEPEAKPEPEPEPKPGFAVSERSARAILASGPPPVPEPARSEPQVQHEQEPELEEPEPEPEPEPEAVPEPLGEPREWSIWELQRLIRGHADDPRQEEWAALVQSLRDFASVDGTLPVEFDPLVRDSFGALLAAELETEVVVAP